jgi:P-type Cu+ transporter
MEKDPVCGMDVDPNRAVAKSEYQGEPYVFCSLECRDSFQKEPARYARKESGVGASSR